MSIDHVIDAILEYHEERMAEGALQVDILAEIEAGKQQALNFIHNPDTDD